MAKSRQAGGDMAHPYSRTIKAHVAPYEVYTGICDVARWWTEGFAGSARVRGEEFKVQFGDIYFDFEVVEAVPGKRMVWRVTDCYLDWLDNKEWTGTRVVWDISYADGLTTVQMTHEGLTPANECYDLCEPGWDFYVGKSLLALLQKGEGLPDGM